MQYVGKLYRPPSEADAFILQATIGCSWNKCTYCDMYRDKPTFSVRPIGDSIADIVEVAAEVGRYVSKVFVADGDALVMDMEHWRAILGACSEHFPMLRRVSCYATATNILDKSDEELAELSRLGLKLLYVGPESGDDATLRRIAKGSNFDDHVRAAEKARKAGLKLSAIFLLGAGGVDRSDEHARESARLITAMDPEYLAALTLTVVPGTPIDKLQQSGRFELPGPAQLLAELRTMVADSSPTQALFRTNHASNYLPLAGHLPADRDRIVDVIDRALAGEHALRMPASRTDPNAL